MFYLISKSITTTLHGAGRSLTTASYKSKGSVLTNCDQISILPRLIHKARKMVRSKEQGEGQRNELRHVNYLLLLLPTSASGFSSKTKSNLSICTTTGSTCTLLSDGSYMIKKKTQLGKESEYKKHRKCCKNQPKFHLPLHCYNSRNQK